MPEKTWKKVERAVAAYFGGERVPITGRARGSAPDVRHPLLAIEVKHRASLPGWLTEAVAQAEASAEEGQWPIVVLHLNRAVAGKSLVVMRAEELNKRLPAILYPSMGAGT